ncbi:MAG: phosphotransferase, partial [Alphaproteobacteria bacterium]|nr:phosphotransferase [Alphaproteobacteria bacterium]
ADAAPTATLPPQPTNPPITPTPAPTIFVEPRIVEVEWPERLHFGDSDVVRLALIPTTDGYTVTTEFPDHKTITQDVPVVRPEGYELNGVGRLNGVGFMIAPNEDQVRSLPLDESVVWHWSLTPQQPGRQRITVTLLLRWEPLAGTTGKTREAVAYSKGLEIQVSSFFGLTRGQALTTGLFGAVFGGGMSLFALIYRPGTPKPKVRLLTHTPNAQLVIECPAGVHLQPQDEAILQSLFSRYARLIIQSEFLSGYSGARTFLLRPIRTDGRADADTIAKLGDTPAIQQEFQNYETFVQHTLPPITARIQSPPVTPQSNGRRAGLQYTFIGESGRPPTSLRQSFLADPNPALLTKLFETFGPNWWMQRNPYTFRLAQEYDRVLPPHYVIEPDFGVGRGVAGNTPPEELNLVPGDRITLRNFPIQERRADGQSFSIKGEPAPGHPQLRIRWQDSDLPKRPTGRVIATRNELLCSYVAGFDLFGLPDPLEKLPKLLGETIRGTQSIIHGDLNLENILVGPGEFVWLIDFATTREGHPLA